MAQQRREKMDLPNCFRLFDVDKAAEAANINPLVHEHLRPLIRRLSARHPVWEFHAMQPNAAKVERGNAYHGRFRVIDGDDELGWIETTTKYVRGSSRRTFQYENHRTINRRRSNTISTIDINKAYNDIIKNFYTLTTGERVGNAKSMISTQVSKHHQKASNAFTQSKNKLDQHVLRFAMRRWKEFMAEVDDVELKDVARGFPQIARTYQQMTALNNARNNEKGFSVIARGDQYIVAPNLYGQQAVIIAAERLPEVLRERLGLLKLAEIDTPLPDVGIRVSTTVFHVVVLEE